MQQDTARDPLAEAMAAFKDLNDRVVAGLQPAVNATERMRTALKPFRPPVLEKEDHADFDRLLNEIPDQSRDLGEIRQILEEMRPLLASLSEADDTRRTARARPLGRTLRIDAPKGWIWKSDAERKYSIPQSTMSRWKQLIRRECPEAVQLNTDEHQVLLRIDALEDFMRQRKRL